MKRSGRLAAASVVILRFGIDGVGKLVHMFPFPLLLWAARALLCPGPLLSLCVTTRCVGATARSMLHRAHVAGRALHWQQGGHVAVD